MTKKIMYAKIPEFDEITQYVIQLPPMESEDEVYYGIEVKNIEISDNFSDELEQLF